MWFFKKPRFFDPVNFKYFSINRVILSNKMIKEVEERI